MLLCPVPWAGRVWALPFLTVLAPSERCRQAQGKRHKKLTDWARQMRLQLRRWLPGRALVVVADAGYAVLDLLHRCRGLKEPITLITRLRLDAALYDPAPERRPGQAGRPRRKGQRLPTLAQALSAPGTAWAPRTVAAWYGQGKRQIETASGTAVWYHNGMPPVPIRWVLIRDPQASLTRRRCCALTWGRSQGRSSPGSFGAGRWRAPSSRCAPTWGWRRSGSGASGPSCARRRPCSGCSRW